MTKKREFVKHKRILVMLIREHDIDSDIRTLYTEISLNWY